MAPSAAQKVFNLPEFLENILIHLPKPLKLFEDDAKLERDNSWWTAKRFPQPIFQLFLLKRVNNTFKDTIEGSKTCRQLMHLEPTDDSLQVQQDLVNWLLRELGWRTDLQQGRLALSSAFGEGESIFQSKATTAYFADLQTWRALSWRGSEVDISMHVVKRSRNKKRGFRHKGHFQMDSRLGGLFDWIVELME